MKNPILGILIAAGTCLGAAAFAADNTVYSCTDANGATSLTNVPTGGNCEVLMTYTAPSPSAPSAPEPAAAPAAEAAPAASAAAPRDTAPVIAKRTAPQRDLAREASLVDASAPAAQPNSMLQMSAALRRDAVIQQTREAYASGQEAPGTNRAVNRRYLMTNRSDYQQALGISPN